MSDQAGAASNRPVPNRGSSPGNRLLLTVAGIGALLAVGSCVLFVVYSGERTVEQTSACADSQRTLAHAILLYAFDNDDRLPLADRWQESLTLYQPDASTIHCPNVPPGQCGYAFQKDLGATQLGSLPSPVTATMMFDSVAIRANSVGDETSLPRPGRHRKGTQGNLVTYADGHTAFVPDR